jgi:imidazolonepropionase-like amidohydrolase
MLLRLVSGLLGFLSKITRESVLLELAVVAFAATSGCTTPRTHQEVRGLWDAHSHLSWYGEQALDSLLKYGVVGVRDVGGDAIQLRTWRDQIARGERIGPRIFFAGPVIDGPKKNPRFRAIVQTPAEGRRAVDSLADLGVDFIKTHNGLTPEVYFAVIREAHARHLKVASHLPKGIPAWVAVDSGVESIEHAGESMLASPIYAGYAKDVEEAKVWWSSPAGDSMIARLARQHMVFVPTLVAYRAVALSEPVGPSRDAWLSTFRFLVELTGRMYRAGIVILAGTDYSTPSFAVVPGQSVLEEIKLLESAGLSHDAAVDAASVNIVRWLEKR